ncbi:MAG: lactate dehydrogenase [Clostridia bacterium]|nr:lactate dehydrogenase [Clostridia bacterium]
MVEFIGIIAALLIVFSMSFPTMSFKWSICMRVLNIVGSAVFVVYGVLLPAVATAIANSALIIINGYHLYKLIKTKRNKGE